MRVIFSLLILALVFTSSCQKPSSLESSSGNCKELKEKVSELTKLSDSLSHTIDLIRQEDIFHEAIELEEFGLFHEAEKKFHWIIKTYPNGRYAKKSKEKLAEIKHILDQLNKSEIKKPASRPQDSEKPFQTREFYEMFKGDKEVATKLYKNKFVLLQGYVKSIHNYSTEHVTNIDVELNDHNGEAIYVICNINNKKDRDILKNYKEGDPIKLRGRYEFRFLEIPHVEECSIVP